MSEQLKPCHCGAEPHISPRVEKGWKAFCDQGNQDHICIVYGKTKREAIKKWNATRPPQNSEPPMTQTFQDGVNYVLENPSDYGLVPRQNSGASVEEIEAVVYQARRNWKKATTARGIMTIDRFLAQALHAKLATPQADKGEELEK